MLIITWKTFLINSKNISQQDASTADRHHPGPAPGEPAGGSQAAAHGGGGAGPDRRGQRRQGRPQAVRGDAEQRPGEGHHQCGDDDDNDDDDDGDDAGE